MKFSKILMVLWILGCSPSLSWSASRSMKPQESSFPGWMARHQNNVKSIKHAQPNVVFVGDSITQELEFRGRDANDINSVWQKYFACINSFNLGSVGDTTSNVLWRLGDGELEGISPKVTVVLIGTNDLGPQHRRSPAETVDGIMQVVGLIAEKLPRTKIILIELLPREYEEAEVERTNVLLQSAFSNNSHVRLVSLKDALLVDGKIDRRLFREFGTSRPLLHPNAQGWAKMAAVLAPQIYNMVGNKCTR